MTGIRKTVENPKYSIFKNGQLHITYGFMDKDYGVDHYGADCVPGAVGVADYVVADEDGIIESVKDTVKGQVEKITSTDALGNNIKLRHSAKDISRYCHLAYGSIKVKPGDIVKKGDVLAKMGDTGYCFGAHVHFERYIGTVRKDPLLYFTGEQIITVDEKYRAKKNDTQIQENTSTTQSTQIKYIVNTALLNIRTAPGLSAGLAGSPIKQGVVVDAYIGTEKYIDGYTWINITVNNIKCWIAKDYLK